jgi:transketolase
MGGLRSRGMARVFRRIGGGSRQNSTQVSIFAGGRVRRRGRRPIVGAMAEDRPRRERGWRGSADLWLDAAHAILVESGVGAVKIDALADRLGLSRTSFYWHFADREALLAARAVVAQSVRVPACHAGGRGFEPRPPRHFADVDGHDSAAVLAALTEARAEADRPTLIACRTIIGYGAPTKQGREEVHGAPLGAEEAARTRTALGWPYPPFVVPEDIRQAWDGRARGAAVEAEWEALFAAYRARHPELAAELLRRSAGLLPEGFDAHVAAEAARILDAPPARQPIRKASNRVLGNLLANLPEVIGGSADVSHSTLAWTSAARSITPDDLTGNFVHYGVREFGMSAMMNGMAAHGGLIPYGACYLVFSDYARPAVRLSALMGLRSIFLYSHDSIGVGEDGPTHQPAEQLVALRAVPGLTLWRPASELEALIAWEQAMKRQGPSVIVAARQDGAVFAHGPDDAAAIRRGGYVLREAARPPEIVLAATGSELGLALEAAEALAAQGRAARVVSIPNANRFARQDAAWREAVLPPGVPTIFIEAASPLSWYPFLRGPGTVIGVEGFGASAPGPEVYRALGLTAERVLAEAGRLLG